MNVNRSLRLYDAIRMPGIVLHELAHLLVVLLIPGISVDEVDLTDRVEHSGKYTGTRMFLISYAPLYINTIIAYIILRQVNSMVMTSIYSYILGAMGIFLAVSFGIGAIPSYKDAKNPIEITKRCVSANPISFSLIFAPVILLLSIPVLIISYLINRFMFAGIIFPLSYVGVICLVAFGYVDYDVFDILVHQLDSMTN